jgi:hypothetical protein
MTSYEMLLVVSNERLPDMTSYEMLLVVSNERLPDMTSYEMLLVVCVLPKSHTQKTTIKNSKYLILIRLLFLVTCFKDVRSWQPQ